LGVLTEIDDDLCIPIGQEPVHGMCGVESLIIKKVLDKPVERKGREVHFEDHIGLQGTQFMPDYRTNFPTLQWESYTSQTYSLDGSALILSFGAFKVEAGAEIRSSLY
jgi:hypothetical protein